MEIGHGDTKLIDVLQQGFPFVGELHAGGQRRSILGGRRATGRPAKGVVATLDELRAQCPAVNQRTTAQEPYQSTMWKVWKKTKAEVADGKIGMLRDIEDVDVENALLAARFGMLEKASATN